MSSRGLDTGLEELVLFVTGSHGTPLQMESEALRSDVAPGAGDRGGRTDAVRGESTALSSML